MLPALRNGSALAPVAGNRLATLFDHFFNNDDFVTPTAGWAVLPLAMWQDEHNVYIEADVPGMTDRDIDLSFQDGALILRGERKWERQGGLYDNRRYGRFEQRVILPADVDADRVEAKISCGVLHVTLPKSEAARPRKITVKAE